MKKLFSIVMAIALLSCVCLSVAAETTSGDSVVVPYEELLYPVGDVNMDESINSMDLVSLAKIIVGKEVAKSNRTINIDGIEEVNIFDLIRLKKHTLDNKNVILG